MDVSSRRSSIRSPERGRARSRSPRRSISPRSDSRRRSASRSLSVERRNGARSRSRSLSLSHSKPMSRSPSRSRSRGDRRYRSRSYSPAPSYDDSPPRSSKVVVEKLTKNVSTAHLHEIFGRFGDIQNLELPMNRAFMTNRGTAYIIYDDPADAEAAISHMHEAQLDGAVLNVSIVLPRRAFSRSPPPAKAAGRTFGHGPPFDDRYSRQSPPYSRRSPPRRGHPRNRPGDRHDVYRPRSVSRSRSPRRYFSPRSRSRSRTPPRRRQSPRGRRRRSPSYSSYDYSSRSPSRSRSRGR